MTSCYNEREQILNYLRTNETCYVNEIYFMLTSNERIKRYSEFYFMVADFVFYLSLFLSGLLFLINLLFEQKYNFNNEIAIARVYREEHKIKNVYGDIQCVRDDIKNYDFSIYKIGNRASRVHFLFKSYRSLSMKDFNAIKKLMENDLLNEYKFPVFLWYATRIPHTIIFENAIDNLLSNYKHSTLYVGATHERFALIIERLSKKHQKCLICIPHGAVLVAEMPVPYVGDAFYCLSEETASKLNKLYKTSKFIFDEDVVRKMLRINKVNMNIMNDQFKKIVFFTQPINIEATKEIIYKIANFLENKGIKLYLKIHPLEKISDYIIKNTVIINDFGDAIYENVCISLLSTILIEAIYNESTSISIIHLIEKNADINGRYEYLSDSRILKPLTERELMAILDKVLM